MNYMTFVSVTLDVSGQIRFFVLTDSEIGVAAWSALVTLVLAVSSSESFKRRSKFRSWWRLHIKLIIMRNLLSGAHQLRADGSMWSDESSVGNTFGYQLGCFPENGLSFLGNDQDEEDPNDHLYYNWVDMDNYEDADGTNRSSNAICGLASTTHGDELGWFPLTDEFRGTEDALGVPCSDSRSRKRVFGNDDTWRLDCMTHSSSESDLEESSATYRESSLPSIKSHDFLQIDEQNKKPKCEKQFGLNRDQLPENDSSFFIEDISNSGQHQAQVHDSKLFGYLQSETPSTCSVYRSSSDITSLNQCPTAIQSENISHSMHDFYALDGMHSMKGSMESLPPVVPSASGDARDQMYQHQGFKASSNENPKNADFPFQFSLFDTISNETPVESPTNNECNDGVNLSISAKSDGYGTHEKDESFKLDDILIGASSFRQLQLAMSLLDPRTKLSIRDSLYRLAWSAEKSHFYDSLNGGSIEDRDSTFAEGINTDMEMETDTNPIDRSIAHLMFHRAADKSVSAG